MKERHDIILMKMKIYAEQAIEFKCDLDFEAFTNDAKTVAACVLNLSQIGELVGRLDAEFMEKNKQIPWRKIKGMRNRIIHDYDDIRLNIVWDVLVDFLPELITNIDDLYNKSK